MFIVTVDLGEVFIYIVKAGSRNEALGKAFSAVTSIQRVIDRNISVTEGDFVVQDFKMDDSGITLVS